MITTRRAVITEKGESFVELTSDQAVALQALGFCTVTPTSTHGRWRITDVTRVGVIAVDDLTLIISPKTPVESLLFMASYSGMQVDLSPTRIASSTHTDLPSALAIAFCTITTDAVLRGLLKGYVPTEEAATVIRGRWDIARQWRVRPGIPSPAEVNYDDFTEDVIENQILHTALRALSGVPTLSADARRAIAAARVLFADVSLIPLGRGVPKILSTRLNQHYRPALRVAEWILESVSWAHRRGKRELDAFLVNVAALYERFVSDVFRSTLAPAGVCVESQLTSWTLDREGQIKLRPDLVLAAGGRTVTVADTKYKVWGQTSSSPQSADVYQALAYALRAGVSTSHLLYVSGDVVPQTYSIDSAGVQVVAHAIDISGSPVELLNRTAATARLIATYPREAKAEVA